jgi:hypothetical protein
LEDLPVTRRHLAFSVLVLSIVSMLAHELGHILAAFWFGISICEIGLRWTGLLFITS